MFDWVTWSIWLLGFVILVIWVWVPIREFRQILQRHRNEQGNSAETT